MLNLTLDKSPLGKNHYGEGLIFILPDGKQITIRTRMKRNEVRMSIDAPEEIRIYREKALRKASSSQGGEH